MDILLSFKSRSKIKMDKNPTFNMCRINSGSYHAFDNCYLQSQFLTQHIKFSSFVSSLLIFLLTDTPRHLLFICCPDSTDLVCSQARYLSIPCWLMNPVVNLNMKDNLHSSEWVLPQKNIVIALQGVVLLKMSLGLSNDNWILRIPKEWRKKQQQQKGCFSRSMYAPTNWL